MDINQVNNLIKAYGTKTNEILEKMNQFVEKRQKEIDEYKYKQVLNKLDALQKPV